MTIERQDMNTRMSKIVKHNGTVYLAGQLCKPEDESLDLSGQTQSMLDKVDGLLIKAGSDRNHILSAAIFVSDMSKVNDMNAVYDAWVPQGHCPVRYCVEAQFARKELLVEISIVAAEIE
ncbi:RidA family protein [Dasania marina]|uniref:RidA family protein n=1 Tax=Dasania marina TaxID=471499 RepID=UPI0030DB4247|tara:strand:+ start:5811 stop:6170 length:360 start_codon:yes stop_codon:yes gene_type:complete